MRPRALRLCLLGTVVLGLGMGLGPGSSSPARAESSFNARMVSLVNEARAANGLAPVTATTSLSAVAEGAPYTGCGTTVYGRAVDMGQRNYFSHAIASCGDRQVFDMLGAAGVTYSAAGENIGWGSGLTDPVAAANSLHTAFMSSPPHRANLLDARYNSVGVGSWRSAPGQSWSGGGAAVTNVYVTAVVFAQLPTAGPPPTAAVPNRPASVVAAPGRGQALVSWAPVASPPGTPVDAHAVLAFGPDGYTGAAVFPCATCTSAAVPGLADGAWFYLAVLAHSRSGWSEAGFSGWVMPGTPSAPGRVAASPGPGPGRVNVSWTAPANTNGSPVQAYAALAFDEAGYAGYYATACATCTSATITGLPAGRRVVVAVLAYNATGWGTGAASGWVTVG